MRHIKIENRDQVQWITLARPEKRNAFHPEMIGELTQAFRAAGTSKLRSVVLSGEGESFCSGGDLEWMKSMASYSLEENRRDSEALFDMYDAVRLCPLPVIGRAQGHAMGGGLGLLAVCDIVLAESKTQFCFSEVKWGLAPAVISSFVLEKVQPHRAREWMLTAAVFSANEAHAAGLVNFAGDSKSVDESLTRTLKLLRQGAPEAVTETKKLLRFLIDHPRGEYRAECARVIAERRVSKEGQTGLKSFLEKKPTPWG